MNLEHITKTLFCLALCVLVSACNEQQLVIKLLYSDNHCGIDKQTIQRISDATELARLFDAKPKKFAATKTALTTIDFDKAEHNEQDLILVALGEKPSSGYHIELIQQYAVLKDNKLYLPIRLHQPEKNSFQAQVMTSPCQIFSIAKTEFDEVVLMDIANGG